MNELQVVGQAVADSAGKIVRHLVTDPGLPSIVTSNDAEWAIDRVVRQDSRTTSKRIWSAVFGVLTIVLLVPEVQGLFALAAADALTVPAAADALGKATDAVLAAPEVTSMLGTWAPIVTGIVSTSLSLLSKFLDPRPTR